MAGTWRDAVHDLALSLGGDDPLLVVLGAGGSLSSNAPGTGEVDRAFRDAMTHVPPEELEDRIHHLPPADVRATLAPLFADVSPYVGYRCLAAIARTRRVVVFNLNWDPLPGRACDLLDVPYVSYDLKDRAAWADLPEGSGLTDIHLHGMIDGEPRHGARRTLGFDAAEMDHLLGYWCASRRVVTGTSLDRAHDVIELLARLEHEAEQVEPQSTWAFTRATGMFPDELRGRYVHVIEDNTLDFDELMHALVDGLSEKGWDDYRQEDRNSAIPLPALADLLWPQAALLRPALDNKLVALIGDPQLGKTTVAHFLAHLHRLLHGRDVRAFSGPNETTAAVSADPENDAVTLILENPYGEYDAPNEVFVEQLVHTVERGDGLVIVTSRLAAWQRAGVHGRVSGAGAVLNADPQRWYSLSALARLAKSLERPGVKIEDKVQRGWLDTPARVQDQAGGLHVSRASTRVDRELAVLRDRLRLLEDDAGLAALATVARLQEVAGEALPMTRLLTAAATLELDGPSSAMFHRYEYEDEERLRLRSAADGRAVDEYLSAHPDQLTSILRRGPVPQSVRSAAEPWRALSLARSDGGESLADVTDDVVQALGGRLLSAVPTELAVRRLVDAQFDQWSAADVAYPLVRLWGELPAPARRQLLERIVTDPEARGAYAVLEACLYLQRAAPAEVWAMVKDAIYRLPDDDAGRWERALIFDGLLWRPAGEHDDDLAAWARGFMDTADEELRGVLRFSSAYHALGVDALDFTAVAELLEHEQWNPFEARLAARLAAWHFVHQSHARAQLGGQHWIDKEYLCRTLHLQPASAAGGALTALLTGLIAHGHGGWAFHVGCNLSALEVGLEPLHVDRLCAALSAADIADAGLVSAVATYDYARTGAFTGAMESYFADSRNKDSLLDAFGYGVHAFGELVTPPRFQFARRPAAAHRVAGIRFERLQQALGTGEPADVVRQLELAAVSHLEADRESPEHVAEVLDIAGRGDLRLLEFAAAAMDDRMPPAESIILEAAARLREERDGAGNECDGG